ncbi:MAG: hypothetical protein ACQEQS_07475 [Thermodesulfobacteriota bacterium]
MKSKTLPAFVINGFFIIGLVSALLFRMMIFFDYYSPFLGKIIWYCAVIGYLFFFGFRYYISHKRRKTILKNNLTEKVKNSDMDDNSRDEVVYLLNSIIKSKEMFNYIFIFAVSIIAIAADIILFSC